IAAVLVALLLGAAFTVVHYARARDAAKLALLTEKHAATAPPVDVVRVAAAPASSSLALPGETRAWYRATVYARVSGYVAKWYVDIGDRVQKGQVLASIDTPELDQKLIAAQAELKAGEAEVAVKQAESDFAKSSFERWRDSPRGVVSDQERDAKKAAYASAVATLNAAHARVNLDQALIQGLLALTHYKEVTAPFDGLITERHVDIGDLVTAGSTANTTSMFTLVQSEELRVFVDVPQNASVALKDGTPAKITVGEYSDRVFPGKITRTSEALDPRARTLRVEVDIPNADLALRPGMYVRVSFEQEQGSKPLLQIPASALLFRTNGPQAAVVGDDGVVSFRDLTIARDDGNMVEIGSGLHEGERVVLNISNQIAAGDKVNATETPGSPAPAR
ncbi:MAG TPA: efflux RND transporter periplasmic adaptor subunit, partial [Stellaceae bacterium]|nr:efflux RND transporter periplasmic adaptor subunit [Stellaceae bacterium]